MGCSSSIHAVPPTGATHAAQQGGGAAATKPQPVTPDSRLLRGQAYYSAGKAAEALKEFNATIASWPSYARAYLERGNVRLDQKDYSLAIGDYTMALQLQGNLLQAYMMRCHARMGLRQYTEALQDAREAERLDPENAQVKALKAQVRKAQAAAGGGVVPTLGPVAVASGGSGGGGAPGSGGGSGDEEDAFAGLDTPKSTPSPSVRKLCMVCMDSERECRLRPCMHAALCVACAEGLMARGYGCPICSSKIEQVERGSFMQTFTVEEAQGVVASARLVATMVSPGKSPLGRRFPPGPAPGAPVLDNIVEGDEEGHTTAENAAAALAAAAASDAGAAAVESQRRRNSSGSGASSSGRASTPPVVLDPHPLATRASSMAQAAAQRSSNGAPVTGEEEAAEEEAAGPKPPLPGEVQDALAGIRQEGSAADDRLQQRRRDSRGGGSGGADPGERIRGGGRGSSSGGCEGDAVADNTADGSDADVTSPAALSAVASTYLANSLADWIDEHGGGGDSPARSAAAAVDVRTKLPPVEEGSDSVAVAAAAEDAEAAGEGRRSFFGFASAASSSAAAATAEVAAVAVAAAVTAEIEPDGRISPNDLNESRPEVAAAEKPVEVGATAAAGPVAEGRAGMASAITQPQFPQSHHVNHCHQPPRAPRGNSWSARSLAAQAAAAALVASGSGGAVATVTTSSHRALGGAYASCGAAAAAARPFSRERTASGRRGENAVIAMLPPRQRPAAAVSPPPPPPPLPPRCRSNRRPDVGPVRGRSGGGGGSGVNRGGGRAVGSDPRVRDVFNGRSHSGGGNGIIAVTATDQLLLPGSVPA